MQQIHLQLSDCEGEDEHSTVTFLQKEVEYGRQQDKGLREAVSVLCEV